MRLGTGIIGGGSFPEVLAIGGNGVTPGSTSHAVSLPTGVVAGDLLLVFCAYASASVASPSGWTHIVTNSPPSLFLSAFYRIATGSDTFAYTTSALGVSAGVSMRIRRYSGAPEGAVAGGSGVNPNPPSLSPSWGAKKTLWVAAAGGAMGGGANDNHALTAGPGSFSGFTAFTGHHATFGSRSAGAAWLQSDVGSVDPGTFTLNANLTWRAATIAIRPK